MGNVKNRLSEKGVRTIPTLISDGEQNLLYINEPDLYKVIFQSRKESAERFTDWVAGEVLPSIRKTDSYNKPMTTARKLYAFLEMDKSHYSRWVKANIVDNEFATEMRIIFTRHQWRMKVAGAILLMITNSQPISQRTDGTARKGFNDNKIRNSLF